jgi:hypothetical protein
MWSDDILTPTFLTMVLLLLGTFIVGMVRSAAPRQ